jgi:hypothetical protein
MRVISILPRTSVFLFASIVLCGHASAQQSAPANPPAQAQAAPEAASLKISLRLPDDAPFSGAATIHFKPTGKYKVNGASSKNEGEIIFSDIPTGTYTVEVTAAGFLPVQREIQIAADHGLDSLLVVMKPKPVSVHALENPKSSAAPTAKSRTAHSHTAESPDADSPAANPEDGSWIPPGVDDVIPHVDPDAVCSLPQVVTGAGRRVKELVDNLQKFSATERVEHFMVTSTGVRRTPDVRKFEYVAAISQNSSGAFMVDEYRDGSVDPALFQAHIATRGLPAMALILHPTLAPDYTFTCEGLGQWNGHYAWQVHFVQRSDRPSVIRSYRIAARTYPIPLKGRAWIDPGTYQVVRLETELVKPLDEIHLKKEHIFIQYGPVQFHSQKEQLWLPQIADIYVEKQGRRYYRRHTFSKFKIYSVETAQNIGTPKESYSFKNTSDHDIAGVLTVTPVSGITLNAVSIEFTVPAGKTIFKLVGPGKDISMPVESVGAATFAHNGHADSMTVDAYLVKESTLDVIPDSSVPIHP